MTLSLFSFHVLLFGEGVCLQLSGAGQEAPGIPAGYFSCSVIGRMDGKIKAILKNFGFLVTDGLRANSPQVFVTVLSQTRLSCTQTLCFGGITAFLLRAPTAPLGQACWVAN